MSFYFNLALLGYCLGAVLYAAAIFGKKNILLFARGFLFLGFLSHTISIGLRWFQAGHAPLTNTHESMVFLAWSIVLLYLVFERVYRLQGFGFWISLFTVSVLAYAIFFDRMIHPIMPALQSNWLMFHVALCMLGYGSFAVAFITSLGTLFLKRMKRKDTPLQQLDFLSYKAIVFGFFFLALGIVTGAVWGNDAWGRYWGWDPKETWALITWFIYGLYLHLRATRKWKPEPLAWVSVVGFFAVVFTYLGVNYLLSGLHSYA
ncbi:MAG: c-type cytochrome biogenesis protein CcsB [Omnitrophica WOR_2 bacterium RIFCSPHIGHO2_02_FULL_52_10]|nr:MAG: c-type cytochrome biogenesis protein CcsB [Omnitrophica WOR_2 bacterium RIFCSPHIGHO2_02_FULL_52_10]